MGAFFTSLSDYFFCKKNVEFKLSIIGFNNAGKTTILQKLRFIDRPVTINTVPTIGINVEDIEIKNVKLKVYDLSGQSKMRATWKYYYESVNGIVFVIDSTCQSNDILAEIRDTIH